MDHNKNQKRADKDRGRGLVETELKNGTRIISEAAPHKNSDEAVDFDSEINETHGLAHLQASDEELQMLLTA